METDEEFSSFFLSEYEPVLRTVSLMLGSREAAEDVTQEAFYSAFVRWRRIRSYDKPGAWVRRVAIRQAGKMRKRRARLETEAPRVEAPMLDTDVRNALDQLSPGQRAAVVLHYFQDLPVAEMAAVLGRSEGTVKTHLHRARARLVALLGEEVNDVAR